MKVVRISAEWQGRRWIREAAVPVMTALRIRAESQAARRIREVELRDSGRGPVGCLGVPRVIRRASS